MLIAEIIKFVYEEFDDYPIGPFFCLVKAVGVTILISLTSVAGVYVLLTSALLFCILTVVPMVFILIKWDGFWADLEYCYIWMWIIGLFISGGISGLLFLPLWLIIPFVLIAIAVVIAGGALVAAGAITAGGVVIAGAATAVPPLIIIGLLYLIYISCPYCSLCFGKCCKKSGECMGNCFIDCYEGVGDFCKSSGKCIGKCCNCENKKATNKLPSINKNTIIFESTCDID